MNKRIIPFIGFIFSAIVAYGTEPDILVTQSGESLKVYNLEVSANSVFYSLSDADNAPVEKISKNNVLIIKKADGTILNLNNNASNPNNNQATESVKNPYEHETVTYEAKTDFTQDKKGNKIICVEDNKGQKIYFRLVPEEDKTLAVTKWQEKGKYEGEEYILPEYVKKGDTIYTVKYIDDQAFYPGTFIDSKYLKKVVFPSTLKEIGYKAFLGRTCLTAIILPENLEKIGEDAFYRCGTKNDIEQIYIPKSVKSIGSGAFRFTGCSLSPNGYFQGHLTCIPDFITTSTCKKYGIDEEAVEAYEKRSKK